MLPDLFNLLKRLSVENKLTLRNRMTARSCMRLPLSEIPPLWYVMLWKACLYKPPCCIYIFQMWIAFIKMHCRQTPLLFMNLQMNFTETELGLLKISGATFGGSPLTWKMLTRRSLKEG